jgi:hypothetical protein
MVFIDFLFLLGLALGQMIATGPGKDAEPSPQLIANGSSTHGTSRR